MHAYASASRIFIVNSSTMVKIYNIQFVDVVLALPPNALRDHPHIIDLDCFKLTEGDVVTGVQIQDTVATIIHAVSSNTLINFLTSMETFRIEFEPKTGPRSTRVIFMKKGNEVIVSRNWSKAVRIQITNKPVYRSVSIPLMHHEMYLTSTQLSVSLLIRTKAGRLRMQL